MGAKDKKEVFAYFYRLFSGPTAPRPETEYRFDAVRRWRFDFAWPDALVAVEVNGNAWHVMGGGRHGKDEDLHKLNAAQAAGWCVFQFTPHMLELEPASCVKLVSDHVAARRHHTGSGGAGILLSAERKAHDQGKKDNREIIK